MGLGESGGVGKWTLVQFFRQERLLSLLVLFRDCCFFFLLRFNAVVSLFFKEESEK